MNFFRMNLVLIFSILITLSLNSFCQTISLEQEAQEAAAFFNERISSAPRDKIDVNLRSHRSSRRTLESHFATAGSKFNLREKNENGIESYSAILRRSVLNLDLHQNVLDVACSNDAVYLRTDNQVVSSLQSLDLSQDWVLVGTNRWNYSLPSHNGKKEPVIYRKLKHGLRTSAFQIREGSMLYAQTEPLGFLDLFSQASIRHVVFPKVDSSGNTRDNQSMDFSVRNQEDMSIGKDWLFSFNYDKTNHRAKEPIEDQSGDIKCEDCWAKFEAGVEIKIDFNFQDGIKNFVLRAFGGYEFKIQYQILLELQKSWSKNLGETPEFELGFFIGPIPFTISLQGSAEFQTDLSAKLAITDTVHAKTDMQIGTKYTVQKGFRDISEFKHQTFDPLDPTVADGSEASLQLAIVPSLSVEFFKLIQVDFSGKPYLKFMLAPKPDVCDAHFSVNYGMYVSAKVPEIDFDVYFYSYSVGPWESGDISIVDETPLDCSMCSACVTVGPKAIPVGHTDPGEYAAIEISFEISNIYCGYYNPSEHISLWVEGSELHQEDCSTSLSFTKEYGRKGEDAEFQTLLKFDGDKYDDYKYIPIKENSGSFDLENYDLSYSIQHMEIFKGGKLEGNSGSHKYVYLESDASYFRAQFDPSYQGSIEKSYSNSFSSSRSDISPGDLISPGYSLKLDASVELDLIPEYHRSFSQDSNVFEFYSQLQGRTTTNLNITNIQAKENQHLLVNISSWGEQFDITLQPQDSSVKTFQGVKQVEYFFTSPIPDKLSISIFPYGSSFVVFEFFKIDTLQPWKKSSSLGSFHLYEITSGTQYLFVNSPEQLSLKLYKSTEESNSSSSSFSSFSSFGPSEESSTFAFNSLLSETPFSSESMTIPRGGCIVDASSYKFAIIQGQVTDLIIADFDVVPLGDYYVQKPIVAPDGKGWAFPVDQEFDLRIQFDKKFESLFKETYIAKKPIQGKDPFPARSGDSCADIGPSYFDFSDCDLQNDEIIVVRFKSFVSDEAFEIVPIEYKDVDTKHQYKVIDVPSPGFRVFKVSIPQGQRSLYMDCEPQGNEKDDPDIYMSSHDLKTIDSANLIDVMRTRLGKDQLGLTEIDGAKILDQGYLYFSVHTYEKMRFVCNVGNEMNAFDGRMKLNQKDEISGDSIRNEKTNITFTIDDQYYLWQDDLYYNDSLRRELVTNLYALNNDNDPNGWNAVVAPILNETSLTSFRFSHDMKTASFLLPSIPEYNPGKDEEIGLRHPNVSSLLPLSVSSDPDIWKMPMVTTQESPSQSSEDHDNSKSNSDSNDSNGSNDSNDSNDSNGSDNSNDSNDSDDESQDVSFSPEIKINMFGVVMCLLLFNLIVM
eukprot:gb/GECH01007350.1/.p1 GENE.gb/GECH01007350.1/~~gb/GECH01007350.1/.p1  ORF type:complete len:1343 (+),score=262.68 gb/GECH01007350.1/:1-4029(+)